ncbi:hypothetical protein CPC08DRAFT_770121 [Agrocybe pediades]|nr:hypothetical protein CPC08DRAFT_770121 [Agrocybe pediades]
MTRRIPIIFRECVFLLPHLHNVHITAHSALLMGLIILVSSEPSPGFQLDFDVYDGDRDIPNLENADDIKILLSQVFVKMVTTGDLKDVDDSLEVPLNDDFLYMTIPHKFRLSFFSWDSLPALVGILSIPQGPFLHATQLKIDIIYWEDPESEENIVQFLSSLAQAHSLWVNSDTLAYIHKISLRYLDRHLLPSLRHLELSSYDMKLASAIEDFLEFREAFETPIQSFTSHGLRGANMTNLERFDGLLFRAYLNTEEVSYVCGSGNPETLDFTATAVNRNSAELGMWVKDLLEELSTLPFLQFDIIPHSNIVYSGREAEE